MFFAVVGLADGEFVVVVAVVVFGFVDEFAVDVDVIVVVPVGQFPLT